MANIRMANALKTKEYDFHFSFGKGTHNPGHGAAEFPEEMIWLWRDYDPAKTEQQFTADPAKKTSRTFVWPLSAVERNRAARDRAGKGSRGREKTGEAYPGKKAMRDLARGTNFPRHRP